MKKIIGKKLLILLLGVVVLTSGIALTVFTLSSPRYASAQELAGNYAFSSAFVREAAEFSKKYWSDDYNRPAAECADDFDMYEEDGGIPIFNDFQTKQLLVRSKNLNIKQTYGAIEKIHDGRGFYVFQYASESQAKTAMEMFKKDKNTKYAEPNAIMSLPPFELEEIFQNDSVMTVYSSPFSNRWGSERIGADLMRDYLDNAGKTNEEILVAVIDTGIAHSHSYLAPRVKTELGWDFYGNKLSAIDGNGHGTHVAGTIVDCTPDNVKLIPVKVLSDGGSGPTLGCILGTRYAAEKGAKVCNLSLGGTSGGSWDETISYANGLGMTCVVAAGNSKDDTEYYFPASSMDAITVAAIGGTRDHPLNISDPYANDAIAFFSNYGDAIDVAAPGVSIVSCFPGNLYASYSGTSMAAPHATAAAVMLCIEYPAYTPAQIKDKVRETTVDCGEAGWDKYYGTGVLDFRIFFGTTVNPTSVAWSKGFVDTEIFDTVATIRNGIGVSDLSVTVFPTNATNKGVEIISSDPGIAYHSNSSVVSVGEGTAILTAAISGFTGTCTVNVTKIQADIWVDYAAPSYAGGSGTKTNPYKIATAEQLAKVAYDATFYTFGEYLIDYYGYGKDVSTHYELVADIDLAGKEWYPISWVDPSISTPTAFFWQGSLNGNYHSISNMTTSSSIAQYYLSELGLFGNTREVTVTNLAMIDVNSCGSIFSYDARALTVKNCYATGASSGFSQRLSGSCIFENCFIENYGGVSHAGFARYGSGVFKNCYSYGEFTTTSPSFYSAFAAGFIYESSGDAQLINCFSATNIVLGENAVNHPYQPELAGFIRRNEGTVSNCYYLDNDLVGIFYDENSSATSLQVKPETFFQNKGNFTNSSNWNSVSLWDFDDTWEINPSINNGYPYLKKFYLSRETTPAAGIDFINERLTGLVSGTYRFNSGADTIVSGTEYQIQSAWFGTTLSIMKLGDGVTNNSAVQSLVIPARAAAPVSVGFSHCTNLQNNNGKIISVTSAMEYKLYFDTTWVTCPDGSVTDLTYGTYQIRYKATSTSFAGNFLVISINGFYMVQEQKTASWIQYLNTRIMLHQNGYADYGTTYKVIANGTVLTFQGGWPDIDESWLGTTVTIVRVGNGTTTYDSVPQELYIPVRPAAPAPVISINCTQTLNDIGTIANVTSAMEYKPSAASTWTSVTGTTISGLAPGTYHVRLKSTVNAFASETALVTIITLGNSDKETTPTAGINFMTEMLTGFFGGGTYRFNSGAETKISGATYSISSTWFGTTVEIVKVGDKATTIDSDPQYLYIPARPAAPTTVGSTNCTTTQQNNGTITNLTSAMQYKSSTASIWKDITGTTVTGLGPGIYDIRLKATAVDFSSAVATVTILTFVTMEPTPTLYIGSYTNTLPYLTYVTINAKYRFNDGEEVLCTGSFTIQQSWFGTTLKIVKVGNGTTTIDSNPQYLDIPERRVAPSVSSTNCTTTLNDDGTIINVTSEMQYRLSTVSAWTDITETTVTNLSHGTYEVRLKGNNSAQIFSSESAFVIINQFSAAEIAPSITTLSLPGGTVGTGYSQTLAAIGDATITWTVDSGSLPGGLSLSGAGLISGTPAVAGTFTFFVKATNSAGSDIKQLSIVIGKASLVPTNFTGTTFIMNGNQQGPIITNSHAGLVTISGNLATDIGNYTAIASINDKANYQWANGTTDDITFLWKIISADDAVTVTFDYNYEGSEPFEVIINKGDTVTLETPTRNGYILKGWYTDKNLEENSKWNFDSPVNQDITLYAKWEKEIPTNDNTILIIAGCAGFLLLGTATFLLVHMPRRKKIK